MFNAFRDRAELAGRGTPFECRPGTTTTGAPGPDVTFVVYCRHELGMSTQLNVYGTREWGGGCRGAWRNVARASARLEDRFMPRPLADQVPRFFAALLRPGISVTARLAT